MISLQVFSPRVASPENKPLRLPLLAQLIGMTHLLEMGHEEQVKGMAGLQEPIQSCQCPDFCLYRYGAL